MIATHATAFTPVEYKNNQFTISSDPSRLDETIIFDFLANESYWWTDLTREKLHRYLQFSLCFGVYDGEQQVGFARVVTDYTTFAYLGDVFIVPSYQGQGLARRLGLPSPLPLSEYLRGRKAEFLRS